MEEEVIVESPSLFRKLLSKLVDLVYIAHQYILSLNNRYEIGLTDKQLHFLVIGFFGMFLLFIVYPLFKWLVEKHKLDMVAWIYVFTILCGLTFLIEIGQGISGTGDMDFADIVAGLFGFIIISIICYIVIFIIRKIKEVIK